MAFCEICNDTGAIPQDMTDGVVTKWKDCPDAECREHRKVLHAGKDKVGQETYEPEK